MDIMTKQKTKEIKFEYRRKFMFPKAKDIKVKTTNEESMAIDNLFCRYVYALAFYKENDYVARSSLRQFFV
jgi:hypothetical protein